MTAARAALLRRTVTLRDGRTVLLRPAGPGDAAGLVELRDSVAAEREFIAAVPGERSVVEEEMSLIGMLSEGGLSLVADAASRPVAHLLVHRRVGPAAGGLGDLAIIVKKEWRSLGLGTGLIRVAVDWCRRVGVMELCLAVFTSNERAISLYRTMGFREQGVRRAQVSLPDGDRDVLLMSLRV